MSALRRFWSSAYRRARRAEGIGEYRRAASLYAEADAPIEAANALLFFAARSTDLEARISAYYDALRWLPSDHERRPEVEANIGNTILQAARLHGVRTPQDCVRLRDAAKRLEAARRPTDAATAYELLGDADEAARCLERAGDIERLEQVLSQAQEAEDHARRLKRLLRDYELDMAGGARIAARQSLSEAAEIAPGDLTVAELLGELERRLIQGQTVALELTDARGTRSVSFVGHEPVTLGREGDVVVRGASVSRAHSEVGFAPCAADGAAREASVETGVFVRDLGSRNGTRVQGIAIAAEARIGGAADIGLGDDVVVAVQATHPRVLRFEVQSGLDRGRIVYAGRGPFRVPGLRATVEFSEGHPTLIPDEGADTRLGHHRCFAPIVLIHGDTLDVGGTRVRVRSQTRSGR